VNHTTAGRTITILVVEDNPGDVRLTIEALKEAELSGRLMVASDGEEAVSMLRAGMSGSGVSVPDLILLDLNLPRKNGREVLAEIKADPALRCIPVVVLTTSQAEDDVVKSYELHANCYITKPIDFERYMEVVKAIECFWVKIVRLPNHHPPG
jgi:two-component system, chemotaxis family, response regulator Rcp1